MIPGIRLFLCGITLFMSIGMDFLKKYLPERCDFYPFENADHRFKKPGELEQIIKITKDIMIG